MKDINFRNPKTQITNSEQISNYNIQTVLTWFAFLLFGFWCLFVICLLMLVFHLFDCSLQSNKARNK